MARLNRGYKKGKPYRDARLKIIAGEGLAESQYFEQIRGVPRIIFHAVQRNTKSSYMHVVDSMDRFLENPKVLGGIKRNIQQGDEVWLVVDMDTGDKSDDQRADLLKVCRQKGYRVAFSNPCFEAWLLLSLDTFDLKRGPQLVGRGGGKLCNKELKDLCGSYNKAKPDFRPFIDLAGAIERAQELDNSSERWPEGFGSRVYQIFDGLEIGQVSFEPPVK